MLYRVEDIATKVFERLVQLVHRARARQQSRHKAISIFPWEPGPAKACGLKFKSFRRARDRFKFAKFRGAGIQLFDDGSVRKRQTKRSGERDGDENCIKPHGTNIHCALNIKRTSKLHKNLGISRDWLETSCTTLGIFVVKR